MNIDLASFIVRGFNGSVDTEGTLIKFAETLSAWEEARSAEDMTIGAALHALFDANPLKRLGSSFIMSQVLPALGATPETWGETEDKVTNYLKASPEFDSRVGRGGGGGRLRDLPAPAKG